MSPLAKIPTRPRFDALVCSPFDSFLSLLKSLGRFVEPPLWIRPGARTVSSHARPAGPRKRLNSYVGTLTEMYTFRQVLVGQIRNLDGMRGPDLNSNNEEGARSSSFREPTRYFRFGA